MFVIVILSPALLGIFIFKINLSVFAVITKKSTINSRIPCLIYKYLAK